MYEKSIRYCIMNRNKRGITLDLTRPQGLDLQNDLLADADLVVDNYSVEVLPRLRASAMRRSAASSIQSS